MLHASQQPSPSVLRGSTSPRAGRRRVRGRAARDRPRRGASVRDATAPTRRDGARGERRRSPAATRVSAGRRDIRRRRRRRRLFRPPTRACTRRSAQSRLARASSAAARSRRQRRLDVDPLARDRVREREPRRVQELPLEAEVARHAVDPVARRPAARSPPGARGSGASAPSRAGRAAARARAAARRARSASPRRAACPCRASAAAGRCGRGRSAPRCARAATAAGRGRARGTRARARGARTSACSRAYACSVCATTMQPGRVAVEPVHDAAAAPSSPPAATPTSAWTSVPVACPAAGMDDEARGLVDDEQVLVLVGDAKLDAPRAASGCGAAGASNSTSSPPCSRHAFARATPSTSTPAAISALGRGARADVRRDERGRVARPRRRQERGRAGRGSRSRDERERAGCRRRRR